MSAEEAVWPALLALKREVTGQAGAPLTEEDQQAFRAATIERWLPKAPTKGPLTLNVAMEIVSHEAIVREAYKDSVGVWTWSVGITNASGHQVYPRYKDNPQTVAKCLDIFLWALREKYVPAVAKAFEGHALTEAQFAAALSFHYNTGRIATADWVADVKAGRTDAARLAIMNWRKPAAIIPRREKERDLFFNGKWSNDGCATIFPVRKPRYQPDFAHPERVDIRPILNGLLA
jgi:lysozyme